MTGHLQYTISVSFTRKYLLMGIIQIFAASGENMNHWFLFSFILYEKKAWEVAQAPFKNLLMMGFMMWMAGSTVHLFSIGITFSALWQPISALQGVGKGMIPWLPKYFSCFFIWSVFCSLHCMWDLKACLVLTKISLSGQIMKNLYGIRCYLS